MTLDIVLTVAVWPGLVILGQIQESLDTLITMFPVIAADMLSTLPLSPRWLSSSQQVAKMSIMLRKGLHSSRDEMYHLKQGELSLHCMNLILFKMHICFWGVQLITDLGHKGLEGIRHWYNEAFWWEECWERKCPREEIGCSLFFSCPCVQQWDEWLH